MTDDSATEAPPRPFAPPEPQGGREPGPEGGQLTRSRRHKVIGGVCGGFGRYYNLDPVIVRVPLAVLSVIGGVGFVAYGVAWLLIPFEKEEENEGRRMLSGRVEGPGLTALLFIVAGCGLLLASLGRRSSGTWFSVMLLGAVAGVGLWQRRRDATRSARAAGAPVDEATAQVVAEAPPEAHAPPAPHGPAWWHGPGAPGGPRYLWGPADASPGDLLPPGPPPGVPDVERPRDPWSVPPPRSPVPPGECEARLGGPVLLLALCAAVLGTAAAWDREPLGTTLVVGLASALAVFGAGLVLSAFWGRLGGGTVVAVVTTGVLLAGASVLPENITTSWADTRWSPATASAVRDGYELGSGTAVLDLSAIELAPGEVLGTGVEAGAGQVRVIVPRDAEVTVTVEMGMGAFDYGPRPGAWPEGGFPDETWGGIDQERTDTYAPPDGVTPSGSVELRLGMGLGVLAVERA
ncbi:PspC domain-containing protein [Streptomyces radicis]|uniref:PspC domain-containing protein n=1 Tax=Streptomyces radicis TaxID=1750517 RepID=A0A3A9WF67_9ACTN|nr:PspC domain-containing protein [Streptomyces radicis]RKN08064.1 PspC domain-containing protein [Streptomyces radicis]RKN20419.1 PspC domain-containing protein [Streptomyces radicis]